jgi:hypothetical protein
MLMNGFQDDGKWGFHGAKGITPDIAYGATIAPGNVLSVFKAHPRLDIALLLRIIRSRQGLHRRVA